MKTGEIIIYQTSNGKTNLDVKLEQDTVWLTQAQMVELFDRERSVITKHINNIFKENELQEKSNVRFLHIAISDKPVKIYSLDVIISVGYRVKSQRGTQFRIWANKVLKEYLVKGYTINQEAKLHQFKDALESIKLLTSIAARQEIRDDQANGLLQVIKDYTYGLDILDQYDHQQLNIEKTNFGDQFRATYGNAMDGYELYPSIEEKAAMLLYLITKNHSFSDGKKRIAAFLFLWFMERNGILYHPDGTKRIENNVLVALTLMIAESRTEEKDIMVKVIVNLINNNN